MFHIRPARLGPAVAAGLLALTVSTLAVGASAPAAQARPGATATSPVVPLFTEVVQRGVTGKRRGVAGEHMLVRIDPTSLAQLVPGQRLSLPADARTARIRVTRVDRERAYTSWSGTVEGVAVSSFSMVDVGGVFRGSLISPEGAFTLVREKGDRYWWSEADPRGSASGDDVYAPPAGRTSQGGSQGGSRGDSSVDTVMSRKAKRAKINLMFAYTKAAKAEAGSKAALKAAAALVVSQTNETFANSGLKVTVRYKGLVKAKGKESRNVVTNVKRLYKPRDGRFDNLHKARRKHRADLVHLFTTGDQYDVCGAGNLPLSVRGTHPALAWSSSFYSCMPYLVATHEIGHNLGADHIDYRGVTHDSKIPHSYAYYNVPAGYFSVMGYYDPCEDVQVYTCVRLPWLSSPTNTYNGQPLGVGRATDNAKVVRKIAPRVARYLR